MHSFSLPIDAKGPGAAERRRRALFYQSSSAVLEGGDLLLVDKGGHGVLLVLRGEAEPKGLRLIGGASVHIRLEPPADGGLGLADGHLGVGGDGLGQLHGLIHQLLRGIDVADQPQLLGPGWNRRSFV